MLAAGVEMKVVQETLGHTSSAFTADTYTSVFPEVAKAAAEKTAALLSNDGEEARPADTSSHSLRDLTGLIGPVSDHQGRDLLLVTSRHMYPSRGSRRRSRSHARYA
jgi:hypothetical protein